MLFGDALGRTSHMQLARTVGIHKHASLGCGQQNRGTLAEQGVVETVFTEEGNSYVFCLF